jgi:hypothetical protein
VCVCLCVLCVYLPLALNFVICVGCVELLLETIHPFLSGSSTLLLYMLKIVEVLGAYRYVYRESSAIYLTMVILETNVYIFC